MIFFYLLFVPGILTLIDFLYFVAKGKKLFDYFGGLLLDVVQLVGYPILFAMFFHYLHGESMQIYASPWGMLTIPLTLLSIVGYFGIRYAYPFIPQNITIAILMLLASGIFINLSMIHDVFGLESIFSGSIILLYIIQIATNVKRIAT